MEMSVTTENECNVTILKDTTSSKQEKTNLLLTKWISKSVKIEKSIHNLKKVSKVPEISKKIRKIVKKQYKNLFPVQFTVIPHLIESNKPRLFRPRDICICAPTGCGKTLSYVIPILQILSENNDIGIRALVVLPVKDLAFQVYSVFKSLCNSLDLKCALINGFNHLSKEKNEIIKTESGDCVDIVVCTPGRLVDHIRSNENFILDNLKFLVVDEADIIIREEKHDWYSTLINHIQGYIDPIPSIGNSFNTQRPVFQKIFLSATLSCDPYQINKLKPWFPYLFLVPGDNELNLNDGENILNNNESKNSTYVAPDGLKEYFVKVDKEHYRILFLVYLIRSIRKLDSSATPNILCFCNTKESAERLNKILQQFANIKSDYLSCDLAHKKRDKLRTSLDKGHLDILVTVDSMSRGMDFDAVKIVVQYHVPKDLHTYVHRVGRTARKGICGDAFVFCSSKQIFHLKKDLSNFGRQIKERKFPCRKAFKYMDEYNKALGNLQEADNVPEKMED